MFLRTVQGSRGAPLSWACVMSLLARVAQSLSFQLTKGKQQGFKCTSTIPFWVFAVHALDDDFSQQDSSLASSSCASVLPFQRRSSAPTSAGWASTLDFVALRSWSRCRKTSWTPFSRSSMACFASTSCAFRPFGLLQEDHKFGFAALRVEAFPASDVGRHVVHSIAGSCEHVLAQVV